MLNLNFSTNSGFIVCSALQLQKIDLKNDWSFKVRHENISHSFIILQSELLQVPSTSCRCRRVNLILMVRSYSAQQYLLKAYICHLLFTPSRNKASYENKFEIIFLSLKVVFTSVKLTSMLKQCVQLAICGCDIFDRVFPVWCRAFIKIIEFSEFRECEKSVKHELGSVLRIPSVTCVSVVQWYHLCLFHRI